MRTTDFTGSRSQVELVFKGNRQELRTNRRYSHDGITWEDAANGDGGSVIEHDAALGWYYEEGWASTSTVYAFVQFGVEVRNQSGFVNKQAGQIQLVVETQQA